MLSLETAILQMRALLDLVRQFLAFLIFLVSIFTTEKSNSPRAPSRLRLDKTPDLYIQQ